VRILFVQLVLEIGCIFNDQVTKSWCVPLHTAVHGMTLFVVPDYLSDAAMTVLRPDDSAIKFPSLHSDLCVGGPVEFTCFEISMFFESASSAGAERRHIFCLVWRRKSNQRRRRCDRDSCGRLVGAARLT
jgi:hypothetical protein